MNAPALPPDGLCAQTENAARAGPSRPLLAAGLQPVIDAATGGNQSRFARLLGTNGRTVRRWLAGRPDDIPRHIQVLGRALLALSPEAIRALVRAAEGEQTPPDRALPGRRPDRKKLLISRI